MNRGKYRIGGLNGLAAAAMAAALAAPALHAQQSTTPAPPPLPAPTRSPEVIYLPNVTPERFTLGTPTATPTPTPTPAPTATLAPTPAAARPRATAAPRPTTTSAAPAPVTSPAPVPVAAPTSAPLAAPTPVAMATSSSAAQPEVTQSAGMPGWLWALFGAGATALVFGGIWALQRRRRGLAPEEELDEAPAPAPAPVPAAAAPPVAPPLGIAPPPPAAPSGEPFEILLNPGRIEVTEREVLLDFELLIGNVQPSAAENIRVIVAMMSANPDQDRNIAGYHANPIVDPATTAFDLAPGGGGRMPVRLALPRDLVHIVQIHGRPMFVPMVMVELKWRAGISIRRFGADFMVGTPGQGGKLGPIWLDRNQQASQLAATRYLPRQAAAA